MNRYLLDTHVLLWWADDSERLCRRHRSLLQDAGQEFFVSAASVWEVSIKAAQGKITLPIEPLDFFQRLLVENQFYPLPITMAHAAGVFRLPKLHNDPFDRLLIAQACVDGLQMVSEDSVFQKYDLPGLVGRNS